MFFSVLQVSRPRIQEGCQAAVPRLEDPYGAMPGGEQQFPGTQRPSPPGFVWQEPGSSRRHAAELSTEKAGRRREGRVFASRWDKGSEGLSQDWEWGEFLWVPCHSLGGNDHLGKEWPFGTLKELALRHGAPASERPQAPGLAQKPGSWSSQGLCSSSWNMSTESSINTQGSFSMMRQFLMTLSSEDLKPDLGK